MISASKLKNVDVVLCDLAEDKVDSSGPIWHHHGDWTWQSLGTLTSLNHQVGLNRHSLLLHLYTVSEASNMPERNEWQQTMCQLMIQQLIIKAAFSIFSPDGDSMAPWRVNLSISQCCWLLWSRWMQGAAQAQWTIFFFFLHSQPSFQNNALLTTCLLDYCLQLLQSVVSSWFQFGTYNTHNVVTKLWKTWKLLMGHNSHFLLGNKQKKCPQIPLRKTVSFWE